MAVLQQTFNALGIDFAQALHSSPGRTLSIQGLDLSENPRQGLERSLDGAKVMVDQPVGWHQGRAHQMTVKKGRFWGRELHDRAAEGRRAKPAVGCMVWGCSNTSHDAKMVGTMCAPCWEFLVSGEDRAGSRTLDGEPAGFSVEPRARERLMALRGAIGMGRP